ncbi:MAG: glycoside hydrolase family protein [Luminiphilus sp.]
MEHLINMLRRHEGVKSHAYRCSENFITVAVGRNIDPEGGLGLSDDEIDYLLANDIRRCKAELEENFEWYKDLDSVRQDALVDFNFNVGLTTFLKFKKFIAAMKKGDWNAAAKELLSSKYAKQVGARADEIAAMIKTGDYQQANG